MEAKFLASALSFLSIFLAINAQSFANDITEPTDYEIAPAIYYGDSNVNIGEPFSITCIIPITEKIHWLKNGESLTRHNLRHGRDEHAYTLSESAIEGEKHKIEAHLAVRHALKVHEGRYQCNLRHNGYHVLHVRGTTQINEPTESGYQTIDDLTPNSVGEIFTRTWQEQKQQQIPISTHHLHKPYKHLYSNATNTRAESEEGYFDLGYLPAPAPTNRYQDLTTMPWHGSTVGSPSGGGGIHRVYSATPPDFPPPRINMLEHTVAPPEPPTIQLYNQTMPPHHQQQQTTTHATNPSRIGQQSRIGTPNTTSATTHHRVHHQQQLQHTLNGFQKPQPPYAHSSEKYQTYAPQFIQPGLTTATATMSRSSPQPTTSPTTVFVGLMQQPKTFLPIKKGPDSLVPNYDNEEHQMKFYDIRTPLVLSCNVKDAPATEPLRWEKNGTDVFKVESLKGRFRVLDAERKFIIDRAEADDDGLYRCVFNGVSKDIHVVARIVVRVPSNSGVVEGEKLSVICTVLGTDPKLSWSFGNLTLTSSTDRYILKSDSNNIENAVLMIENVTLNDRGEYKCIGRNAANDYIANSTLASDATTVRVKGKLAALWPFLGICAEVLILCLIILIYEKRRNKSELEESDTDPQEQKKKRRNYD
ncbi:uncharacterized protein LOC115631390 [Scaptodrosophila lebanonensis]|uniref:Uncharacterized protein LOC115631390 n=1 Tax=Drosophila lebanonensis TaxID=7225 RepID=A0A6J2U5Y1_DROLE|nr:uncharacterized protein LOC115631390 [Scaptodrosophila lebanonensis]